jgi:hypothetical protein
LFTPIAAVFVEVGKSRTLRDSKLAADATAYSPPFELISCSFGIFPKLYFSKVGNISKIIKFYTDHEFAPGFEIFQRLGNVVNQKNCVKLQIGMLTNGLNRTRILMALVLLLNSFLYCRVAAHSFRRETRSVKALLLGHSKTSYYKVNIQYIVII